LLDNILLAVGANNSDWPAWKCILSKVNKKKARWKTWGRGPGVWKTRGLVENAGSGGKRGVWWKTQGLVENTGSELSSLK